jgi:hypothetical protein
MYYASCTIPRSKAVQYWIQPCPIAATLCFCHGCENVELQILADALFPAVRKNTEKPTKATSNGNVCWQGLLRSEKTHKKPKGRHALCGNHLATEDHRFRRHEPVRKDS